jgi:hypothetical protein
MISMYNKSWQLTLLETFSLRFAPTNLISLFILEEFLANYPSDWRIHCIIALQVGRTLKLSSDYTRVYSRYHFSHQTPTGYLGGSLFLPRYPSKVTMVNYPLAEQAVPGKNRQPGVSGPCLRTHRSLTRV